MVQPAPAQYGYTASPLLEQTMMGHTAHHEKTLSIPITLSDMTYGYYVMPFMITHHPKSLKKSNLVRSSFDEWFRLSSNIYAKPDLLYTRRDLLVRSSAYC